MDQIIDYLKNVHLPRSIKDYQEKKAKKALSKESDEQQLDNIDNLNFAESAFNDTKSSIGSLNQTELLSLDDNFQNNDDIQMRIDLAIARAKEQQGA